MASSAIPPPSPPPVPPRDVVESNVRAALEAEKGGTASRADVAECLRRRPMGLHIPPPGTAIQIEVPLHFPRVAGTRVTVSRA